MTLIFNAAKVFFYLSLTLATIVLTKVFLRVKAIYLRQLQHGLLRHP